jgi:hypothetical protein
MQKRGQLGQFTNPLIYNVIIPTEWGLMANSYHTHLVMALDRLLFFLYLYIRLR